MVITFTPTHELQLSAGIIVNGWYLASVNAESTPMGYYIPSYGYIDARLIRAVRAI